MSARWTRWAGLGAAIVLAAGATGGAPKAQDRIGAGALQAPELLADVSDHSIEITTDFTGTDLVVFGTVDRPGDIAVVVRGPAEQVVVRRKDRIAGIWVNRQSMVFADVPSFYSVATNHPIETFADQRMLQRQGIGLDNLRLRPVDAADASVAEIAEFREALIRAKQRDDVYGIGVGQVAVLNNRLFRTNIFFPANVPTGVYNVSVFLGLAGEEVPGFSTSFFVGKIGVGAEIFAFAQRHAAPYGILAILIAVSAGWLAAAAFRRA